jgi:hypothetical protein
MPRRTSITIQSTARCLGTWLAENADEALVHEAEALPLRRDMVTLLTFVRDHKVVGTQATGNMPLQAIREVTALFVDPPKMENTVYGHTYRVRNEMDVWQLYYLHILADVGGLLDAARVRIWRLTKQGEEFLEAEPRLQAAFLLAVWWYRVNWIVAYPYTGMGDALPAGFSRRTLASLRLLPARIYFPFEEFADQLIARSGLRWSAPDPHTATMALHGAVGRMVIDRLAEFGVVDRRYRKERLGKSTFPTLAAFRITPWGAALLEALSVIGVALQRC